MIQKVNITDIPYSIKMHHILDEWVGKGSQVPLWVTVEGLKETIGMTRAMRWWRHSTYIAGAAPREDCILCFAVKHIREPHSRISDFTGNDYGVRLEIDSRGVVSMTLEKRHP